MPPRRPKAKKASNPYFKKKNSPPTTYIFSDKIRTSFPVYVDETGTRFSAFIKLTPLQSTKNKQYRDKYIKWRLTKVKCIFNPTYNIEDGIEQKLCSLHSFLDHNDELSEASFNSLVAHKKTKEHKTYVNAEHNYIASEAQWFSTQSTPPSMATIWFFGTVSGFAKNPKNTEVGVILFESNIQYKETAVEPVDTIINDQYTFYGNGELELIRKRPEITNDSIVNRERVPENNSREDQVPEIIELSSDEEDKIPEIIEISSDEENQTPEDERTPEIIVLLNILREQTPETAIINGF
ncbi:7004_t:CDS:1 [Dentiscutata heterogama]|uniref:7004_t:CDS:1 n=1 Tax=Dentiscutata heterogama TaxID=1316150 RepID=A0ACA9LTR6_9GLOM|nr:7004_t:CDS:1 [Dentiscutata heterogama]